MKSVVAPDNAFVNQVRDALEHLYDPFHLQRHPLSLLIHAEVAGTSLRTPDGRRLRDDLVTAIQALRPKKNSPVRSPQTRVYDLL